MSFGLFRACIVVLTSSDTLKGRKRDTRAPALPFSLSPWNYAQTRSYTFAFVFHALGRAQNTVRSNIGALANGYFQTHLRKYQESAGTPPAEGLSTDATLGLRISSES